MISDTELDKLIDAEAKATKGPWRRETGRDIVGYGRDICRMFGRFEDDQPDDDADFIASIRNAAPSILAELRASREIIAKLPRTADGVPITPGMEVWHCTQHHWKSKGSDGFAEMTEGIKTKFCTPYCCGRWCWDSGCQGDSGSGEHVKWSDCYSTREAALASKGK